MYIFAIIVTNDTPGFIDYSWINPKDFGWIVNGHGYTGLYVLGM